MAANTVTKIVRFDSETLEALRPLTQIAKDLQRASSQIETFLSGLESMMRLELQGIEDESSEPTLPPLTFAISKPFPD